ncbi:MAG: transposase [Bacteroidales bacterium]|nr:transposase [Bacteroidales bacterium]
MLLSEDKITEIYCLADDFCKFYSETVKNNALEEPGGKRHRNKPNRLSDAEVITILVAFHMGGHRCLKHFYLEFVCRHWTHLFPKTVSYSRFVKLERGVALLLVGDKGHISKELFRELFVDGIQLITKVKSNMKNCLMSVSDKILLRKRAVIESVNDELKNIAQLEHSRHRSFNNFIVNAVAAIAAYCFFPKKPSISVEACPDNQLTIF